jgi:hypothetical protein
LNEPVNKGCVSRFLTTLSGSSILFGVLGDVTAAGMTTRLTALTTNLVREFGLVCSHARKGGGAGYWRHGRDRINDAPYGAHYKLGARIRLGL